MRTLHTDSDSVHTLDEELPRTAALRDDPGLEEFLAKHNPFSMDEAEIDALYVARMESLDREANSVEALNAREFANLRDHLNRLFARSA